MIHEEDTAASHLLHLKVRLERGIEKMRMAMTGKIIRGHVAMVDGICYSDSCKNNVKFVTRPVCELAS